MTDETMGRIRTEVAGVAREISESWEGDVIALDKLIEAVGAGEWDYEEDVFKMFSPARGMTVRAYHGDLNAALALHEALLPGWEWDVASSDAAAVFTGSALSGPSELAASSTPARAWLLAILRAYRQQVQQ
ncbi:hypothetical protein KLEP181_gp63 [Paracoccus phage vB_PmaP_KLEP18-1]|nr:hypothetical protein KLEP181_gp63 [Paracoccus phage vB_PmaP_KLEP18-1]